MLNQVHFCDSLAFVSHLLHLHVLLCILVFCHLAHFSRIVFLVGFTFYHCSFSLYDTSLFGCQSVMNITFLVGFVFFFFLGHT